MSLLTGGRKQAHLVKPEYLHRIVRPKKLAGMMDENRNNGEKYNMAFSPEPEAEGQAECRL